MHSQAYASEQKQTEENLDVYDDEKINELYENEKDIFDESIPFNVKALCDKYDIKTINNIKDVKTTNNIAYFNYKCDIINSHVHENLIDIPTDAITIEHKIYDKKYKTKVIKKTKCVYFSGL